MIQADQTLKYFQQITNNGTKQPDKPFFIGAGLKRVIVTECVALF